MSVRSAVCMGVPVQSFFPPAPPTGEERGPRYDACWTGAVGRCRQPGLRAKSSKNVLRIT